jgi:hypothetical protein
LDGFWSYGATVSLNLHAALIFSIDRRGQKKNQSVIAKNAKRICPASMLPSAHEVVRQ